jgi:hypothetical protein
MPMAGCEHCGRVEPIPGHPEARLGESCARCIECGRPMHWVAINEAVALVRERHDADARRPRARTLAEHA